MTAYNIGLMAGALCSALVFSRVLFWLTRNQMTGWRRAIVANAGSLVLILLVSVVVRGAFEWEAAVLHVSAQSAWLVVDLLVENRPA